MLHSGTECINKIYTPLDNLNLPRHYTFGGGHFSTYGSMYPNNLQMLYCIENQVENLGQQPLNLM